MPALRTLLLGTTLMALACSRPVVRRHDRPSTTARTAAARGADTRMAEVNGAPITREEVFGGAREGGHGGTLSPSREADALEQAVQQELAAQKAVALHLDDDPNFQAEIRAAQSRVNAWRRSQLALLLERQQAGANTVPTEAEMRAFYAANETRIRTELHVQQILLRDEAAAQTLIQQLRAGRGFEEAARATMPLPEGSTDRPWDLGFLRWFQIPEPWRVPLSSLQPGQISEVVRGPNHRFWILTVIEKREGAGASFDEARPAIEQTMQRERLTAARTQMLDALRRDARIQYFTPNHR